jgi:hypothetical protein
MARRPDGIAANRDNPEEPEEPEGLSGFEMH